MKKKKILALAFFAILVLMLTACSLGGGERVLYIKVSEVTLGTDVVTLVHEYRAELKEGNSLELEYYTEDKLVCTLENVSGGGAKLSFSAPLQSDEGNDGTVISLKNGKAAYASTVGNSKEYRYEFSLEKVSENEAVTQQIGEYSNGMDVLEYTEQLTQVFSNNFSADDTFSDIQLLSAARYFFYEHGEEENLISVDGSGQITVPEENMNIIVQNLFGVERDLIECVYEMESFVKDHIKYTNKTKPYGDRYLKYDNVYKFSEDNEEWYCDYRTLMSDGHTVTVNETETAVSVRMVIERYTDEESRTLGNFVIKQDVEYFYEKYVADGFLYYRLKEVKLHGVESDPISLDDVQILKEEGSFSVRGAQILLSTYSTNNVYSIFVDDVTGDGENDVIAKLYGGCACVLDGYTMELYYPRINLSESVALRDNDDELRVWTEDEIYSIPKNGMAISGDDNPYTDREKISVENGKIRFSSSLVINSAGSIGDFECFFVFENGGFVQKGFSYTPIMERDVNFFAYTADESEKINITVHADTFWREYPEFDENTLYYDIAIKPAHYETVKVLRAYRIPENFVLDENAYSITGALDGDGAYYFDPAEDCDIKIGKTESGLDYVSYYEDHYDWVYERTEDGDRTYKLYSGDYMVHALVRVSEEHVVLIKYRENEDNVSRIFKSIEKISFVSCEKENADSSFNVAVTK